ncbi:MAG: MBL fold metallo-hydrolase [Candidatus Bipolaricaulis sp.]|nr:MBL fold metallo-hydrolase [Candidatus Bipolaricaulis sp.]
MLDLDQFGEPRSGAAYLVRGERTALVDTGTARSVPRLIDALRGVSVDSILLTHLHLDHAGGAGVIAIAHPEATIVAHPRALAHLVDPTRLEESARAANHALFPLYGRPTPIPEARLRPAADGEVLDLGRGVRLEAIYSPGHAPHHVCWFEQEERVLFAGDAVGHHDVPVDLPLTVPPRFDLEKALATLSRLRSLRPQRIAYAHFGVADRAEARLATYARDVAAWLDRIASLRARLSEDEILLEILGEPKYASLSAANRGTARLCVTGALASLPKDVR